ncbi:sphingosine hydroxylase [Flagelloscypha sp. PMI_526]|nr:sphingosine hydroxylase [Flagelloscypha sp. PMI_526]
MFGLGNYTTPADYQLCSTFLQGSTPTKLCLSYPNHFPWYFSPNPSLFTQYSDQVVALVTPVVCYWIASIFWHAIDQLETAYVNKYRIHPSEEELSRNPVRKREVFFMVLVQHIIQTGIGYIVLDEGHRVTPENALKGLEYWMRLVEPFVEKVVAEGSKGSVLIRSGYTLYWWIIPSLQFLFAMFVLDTWQYFWHRFFHMNTYLYRTIHSIHHRLYVPYAFGALYNHPLEGFLFDSVGALFAETVSLMTTRQATLLFGISSFKTVDDHCGYSFPWDIFQWFSPNNADYHDIHHQIIGIKSNFSQPFFIHWDYFLNTRMTRADIASRKKKSAGKEE